MTTEDQQQQQKNKTKSELYLSVSGNGRVLINGVILRLNVPLQDEQKQDERLKQYLYVAVKP